MLNRLVMEMMIVSMYDVAPLDRWGCRLGLLVKAVGTVVFELYCLGSMFVFFLLKVRG